MRNALTTMVGMAFLLAAGCGGSMMSDGGSNGTNGGGDSGTPGGPGAVCTADSQCVSNICGITGTGTHCCASACTSVAGETCAQPQDCDDTGKCLYPPAGTSCGETCSSDIQTEKTCDGAGGCSNPKATACAPFGCDGTGTICATSCTEDAGGCDITNFCNQGSCVAKKDTGPCNGDSAECSSGVCAPNGWCCLEKCTHDQYPECAVVACTADAGGSCVYPAVGTICDMANQSCTGSTLNAGQCDGMGTCNLGTSPCPGNLLCSAISSEGCPSQCSSDLNCVNGYYCGSAVANRNKCVAQGGDGGCTANDQCLSGICGLNGTGNCCATACATGNATCGATGCDGTTSLCDYPKEGTSCGASVSCTADVQTNAIVCDGLGTCPNPVPATTNCMPYTCNGPGTGPTGSGAACNTTCKDNTACLTGDFCDPTASACCPTLGASIAVDSAVGKDGACCGAALNPCQTIAYAMKLIDAAQATGTAITATVAGNNGDWTVPGEVYPIVLGWGVDLIAPGVAFIDPGSVAPGGKAGKAIFDIKAFSTSDTVGYASIVGTTANPVVIGMNSKLNQQSTDASAILVEGGNTLYLAGANVNGNSSAVPPSTAITVQTGATLTLGEDQVAKNLGTVTIGTKQGGLNGGSGIVCGAAGAAKACTVNDVSPGMGLGSVVIENQVNYDIDAEDMASISLTADPVIGVAPGQTGFGKCGPKTDASGNPLNPVAVLLHGSATMTFDTGRVQCIAGGGFRLTASASTTPPSLTMDSSTIQNTELGIFASDGTATVTNSTIEFNYNGVEQTTDALSNAGTINLGGGGNTVVCSSDKESVVAMEKTPGVNVLNTTSSNLNASMTAWDTTIPDQFDCNATLTTCSCVSTCTNTAGADDMDAVYTGTGTIVTTGNTQSSIATTYSCN